MTFFVKVSINLQKETRNHASQVQQPGFIPHSFRGFFLKVKTNRKSQISFSFVPVNSFKFVNGTSFSNKRSTKSSLIDWFHHLPPFTPVSPHRFNKIRVLRGRAQTSWSKRTRQRKARSSRSQTSVLTIKEKPRAVMPSPYGFLRELFGRSGNIWRKIVGHFGRIPHLQTSGPKGGKGQSAKIAIYIYKLLLFRPSNSMVGRWKMKFPFEMFPI